MNTEKDNGGPAFPTENDRQTGPNSFHHSGMSLRDYFAAKALQGYLSRHIDMAPIAKEASHEAYLYADAMIEARGASAETGRQASIG